MIINSGIEEIVSYQDFAGDRGAKELLEKAGIILRMVSMPSNLIEFKD